MIKVLLLFGNPIDRRAFDQHFDEVHRRLLTSVPELEALHVNSVAGAAKGESPFHLIAELHFKSEQAMQRGLNSEPGQRMARDFGTFASGGVTVLFCHSSVD